MIKNKKDLEINIERANTILEAARRDVNDANAILEAALNIRNAALAFHNAALDNYYSGSKNDADAYIVARNNYNSAVTKEIKRKRR